MNDVNCKYSNGILPYMYGELATNAATEFESHLLECEKCTDEFAELSAARYEVYDWKKLEFDPLATPAIEIPFGEVVKVSWVEKLRAAFSKSWAMPAAAFAGMAVIVALVGVFVVSRNAGDDLARYQANVIANDNSAPTKPIAPTVAPQPNDEPKVEVTATGQSSPKATFIKETTPRRVVHSQPHAAPRSTTTRTTTAQTPNVPRLNDFADEEDNSLRLAELFEDIDTSE